MLTSRPLYTLLPGNDDQDPHQGGPGGRDGQAVICDGGTVGADDDDASEPGGSSRDQDGASDSPGAAGISDRPAGNDGDGDGDDDDDDNNNNNGDAGQGNGGTRRPGPGPGPSGGRPGPGRGLAFPAGLTGSVNLTVPLATWLGLAGQPGEAAGHGPLDAATSHDLASRLAARPGSQWCLTITGPGGRAIGHGCARAGPPGQHRAARHHRAAKDHQTTRHHRACGQSRSARPARRARK